MINVVIKDKLFLVFIALIGLTLSSWILISLGEIDSKWSGTGLLLLAFIKVQLIITHYMEASAIAPRYIRYAFPAWIWLTGLLCIALYWL